MVFQFTGNGNITGWRSRMSLCESFLVERRNNRRIIGSKLLGFVTQPNLRPWFGLPLAMITPATVSLRSLICPCKVILPQKRNCTFNPNRSRLLWRCSISHALANFCIDNRFSSQPVFRFRTRRETTPFSNVISDLGNPIVTLLG